MRTVGVVVVCALLYATNSLAQGVQTSSIVGVVRDSAGAIVRNAVIDLAGTHLVGGTATTRSDSSGTYRFLALPPGIYRVAGSFAGVLRCCSCRHQPAPWSDSHCRYDIASAEVRAKVSVQDVTPFVDVSAPSSPTRIDTRLLENLPSKHDFNDLIISHELAD